METSHLRALRTSGICFVSSLGGQVDRLAALIERPSHRAFALLLVGLSVIGYAYAVRLPSVGFNVHLYSAFGSYVNATGSLPVAGQSIGSEPFVASYGDFPAISLLIYRVLSLTGEAPNRFVWAAYYIVPVVLAAMALARMGGGRLGLPTSTARATAMVGIILGSFVARGYEDKGYFFWLLVAVFLATSINPLFGAIGGGVLVGWTGLVPLVPLLTASRVSHRFVRRLALFLVSVGTALICVFAAGPASLTLLNNRRMRESSGTFWWGFWQYLGPLDTPAFRVGITLLIAVAILFTYQRGWFSFPGALTLMAVVTVASSNSFGHVRFEMLLPLAVFLLRTSRAQLVYLMVLLAWSAVPLYDFFRYGSIFVDQDASPPMQMFVGVYTNAPIFVLLIMWLYAIPWRSLTVSRSRRSIFEPNAVTN